MHVCVNACKHTHTHTIEELKAEVVIICSCSHMALFRASVYFSAQGTASCLQEMVICDSFGEFSNKTEGNHKLDQLIRGPANCFSKGPDSKDTRIFFF